MSSRESPLNVDVSKIPFLHVVFWARILALRRRLHKFSFLHWHFILLARPRIILSAVFYFFSAGALRLIVADSIVIERELHHSFSRLSVFS